MGGRIRSVVISGAIFTIAAFFVWYVVIHRPSADVTTPETTQDFTDIASLTGTADNPAELDGVIVCTDGIRLARALATSSPTPSDSPVVADDSGLISPSSLAVDSPAADDGLNPPTPTATTEGGELTPPTEPDECQTPLTTATTESSPLGIVPPDPIIALKYRLEAEYGQATPCGGPVGLIVPDSEKLTQFSLVQAEDAVLGAILTQLGIANDGSFTDQEKLRVVEESTRLAGITLGARSDQTDAYTFRLPLPNKSIIGTIQANGTISNTEEGFNVCPLCLATDTQIATPLGLIRVTDLVVGSPIWTQDTSGQQVAGTVLRTSQTPAPANHQMVNLELRDGREVLVSPGHPTADGRTVGDLKVGEEYDGSLIVGADRVRYNQPATYDILPSGPTGLYWAEGIKLGSTLR